jgi:hypothetical protein
MDTALEFILFKMNEDMDPMSEFEEERYFKSLRKRIPEVINE